MDYQPCLYMPLTSYIKRKLKECGSTVQVTNGISWYAKQKMTKVPDSPQAITPKIPVILFPADEVPRPAVIGLGGSPASYVDSATAIKEILASVLKLPSSIKATVPVNEDLQDSDVENESSDCIDDCSDRGPDCIQLTRCTQNDVRFNRHKASWETPLSYSSKDYTMDPLPSPSFPSVPVTSAQGETEMGISPSHKCSSCTERLFQGSAASHLNLPLSLQKDNRRFSSPNLSNTNFNLSFDPFPCDSPSEQITIPLTAAVADPEVCQLEDNKTFHRRSKSYSVLLEASGDSLTLSTETLHRSPENVFEPTVNLEKENQHFLAADLFISVVEKMKSNLQYEQWKAEGGIPWIKDPEEPCFYKRKKANSESATSVDSGYEGLAAVQSSPETIFEEEEESKCPSDYRVYEYEDFVVIEQEDCKELYMAKDLSDKPERPSTVPSSNSAEETARNLYRGFRLQWLHVVGGGFVPTTVTLTPLCCENGISEEFESSISLLEEIKRCKMMESEDWAPPQFEIISTIHPYIKRDVIVASQNYLCAGCGTKVEPRYTNRLRYCDYLGKYFCDCCHNYSESVIPGRILSKWSFSKSYVSNFAKNVLDRIWDSHTFNLQTENAALYNKVKDLSRVKEVQQQLIHIRKLVTMCRLADSVVQAFAELPTHLTEELHFFTLSDLYEVKQKTLLPSLRDLLALGVSHVDKCELCQAKGFICEFCQSGDVIFPFQTEICRKCDGCKACYHKQCFKTNDCPKCARIKAREALKLDSPFTSSGEMELNSST